MSIPQQVDIYGGFRGVDSRTDPAESEVFMPKVTKEVMKSLINAGVFPPRHQRGCPKNYLRMLPLQGAAKGESVDEIRKRIEEIRQELECTCR